MARIQTNKADAARRQVDAAIRMLFQAEDPVPIHTLAMASFGILRNLTEKRGNSIQAEIDSMIKPGMEGKFWGRFFNLANFLKHADKDPEAIHDFAEEEVNDMVLALCAKLYASLGYSLTQEMSALLVWFCCVHEETMASEGWRLPDALAPLRDTLMCMSRTQKLSCGQQVLDFTRSNRTSQY